MMGTLGTFSYQRIPTREEVMDREMAQFGLWLESAKDIPYRPAC
jgi:hypothetical protein